MNLAFYIDSLGGSELNKKIFDCLNGAVKKQNVKDVSLFYNNIDYNPYESKFGQFNATDIWNYTGILIATTIKNIAFASKIVNKFQLYFLYTGENKEDLLALITTSQMVPVFCSTEAAGQEFYRLTGKKAKLLDLTADSLIREIL